MLDGLVSCLMGDVIALSTFSLLEIDLLTTLVGFEETFLASLVGVVAVFEVASVVDLGLDVDDGLVLELLLALVLEADAVADRSVHHQKQGAAR